ncbi:hypothetical protein ACFX14_026038 [Malus domestica]
MKWNERELGLFGFGNEAPLLFWGNVSNGGSDSSRYHTDTKPIAGQREVSSRVQSSSPLSPDLLFLSSQAAFWVDNREQHRVRVLRSVERGDFRYRSNPFADPILPLWNVLRGKVEKLSYIKVSQANNKELTVSPVRSFGNHRKGDAYSWTLPSQQHRLTSHWFKGKLYMLMPVWELGRGTSTKCKGRTFDPHHKLMGKFKAPDSLTAWGALISAYGNLYYHADTTIHLNKFPSPFQCYNPGSDTWEDLPRIHPDLTRWLFDSITGYAVCGGHILVSFGNTFFAYHVRDKKWHRVRYPDGYPGFHGRAVVADYDSPSYGNLVSLGNNVYCFVQCGVKADDCLSLAGDCQSLVITTFNIVGKPGKPGSRSIDTLKVHVYDVEYTRGAGFIYHLSFTFTPDYPCSESEGKDPMVKRDADCRRPTDGQRERERDAKGLEGRGKGHSRRSRRKGLS